MARASRTRALPLAYCSQQPAVAALAAHAAGHDLHVPELACDAVPPALHLAVDDERPADARAERDDDDVRLTASSAEARLRPSCRVGVVVDGDRQGDALRRARRAAARCATTGAARRRRSPGPRRRSRRRRCRRRRCRPDRSGRAAPRRHRRWCPRRLAGEVERWGVSKRTRSRIAPVSSTMPPATFVPPMSMPIASRRLMPASRVRSRAVGVRSRGSGRWVVQVGVGARRAGPALALGRREVAQRRGREADEVGDPLDRVGVDLLHEADELAHRAHPARRRLTPPQVHSRRSRVPAVCRRAPTCRSPAASPCGRRPAAGVPAAPGAVGAGVGTTRTAYRRRRPSRVGRAGRRAGPPPPPPCAAARSVAGRLRWRRARRARRSSSATSVRPRRAS